MKIPIRQAEKMIKHIIESIFDNITLLSCGKGKYKQFREGLTNRLFKEWQKKGWIKKHGGKNEKINWSYNPDIFSNVM